MVALNPPVCDFGQAAIDFDLNPEVGIGEGGMCHHATAEPPGSATGSNPFTQGQGQIQATTRDPSLVDIIRSMMAITVGELGNQLFDQRHKFRQRLRRWLALDDGSGIGRRNLEQHMTAPLLQHGNRPLLAR